MSASVTKMIPAAVILLGAMGLGGCATKSYVREQIAPVSQRVDALEAKLNETDGTAKSALSQAQAASGQAQNNGQRIDQLNARVDGIEQRMAQSQKSGRAIDAVSPLMPIGPVLIGRGPIGSQYRASPHPVGRRPFRVEYQQQ